MAMWVNDCEPLTLGQDAAKFGGFRHCDSVDKNQKLQKTTCLKLCVTLWMDALYSNSPPCQV